MVDNNKKTKDIGLSANKGRPRHTDKQTEGKKSKETKEQEIKRQVGRETDKKKSRRMDRQAPRQTQTCNNTTNLRGRHRICVLARVVYIISFNGDMICSGALV